MKRRSTLILVFWLGCALLAVIIVSRTPYAADLSAFLPASPTPAQQLLIDQLRDGPAARTLLIAIEGGDEAVRAQISKSLVEGLRRDARFTSVANGQVLDEAGDRDFLFSHRYLLSDQVNAQRFSTAGLRAAILENIDNLTSPAGLLLKSLLPRDPTGELLHVVEQISAASPPLVRNGVWVSPDGSRALAVVQTAAAGSDSDAQDRALAAVGAQFAAARSQAGPGAQPVRLHTSGPAVFAAAARTEIATSALRLSLLSSLMVIVLLWMAYRSVAALILGLLPVASGALAGVAAVGVTFGLVYGITLGFGITLIGEAVDYSIYFFIQAGAGWRQRVWPTMRLGMLTSVCGFASLLPSGFPGLQQLGMYSISGLLCAALVTRFVLPALLPASFAIRDLAPFGAAIDRMLSSLRPAHAGFAALAAIVLAAAALLILYRHAQTLWNRELSALSPVSREAQHYDAQLRADLGAADVRALVVITGADLQSVLAGAERAVAALQPLIVAGVIGGFDSPTNYLPSRAIQEARRSGLPDGLQLQENLRRATADLPIRSERLQPFLEDVETTRHAALVGPADLEATSLAAGFNALMLQHPQRWDALLPLHAPLTERPIDADAVAQALQTVQLPQARVLDLKHESDSLYADYLRQAIRLSLWGFAAITALLCIVLRSPLRICKALAPLALAVLTVAAGLVLAGVQLTIMHLVGMLLIVAVGSNYALFFDHEAFQRHGGDPRVLASLVIANVCAVIAFGLLSLSHVPVLVALGATVAPGAFFAFVFCALQPHAAPLPQP